MSQPPDFFLSAAGENADLSDPRACWFWGRLKDNVRDDYMIVEIEPPLIGQRYGLGDKNVSYLVLATRHEGFTLFPIAEWPSHVYIFRVLDEAVLSGSTLKPSQVEMIAWGMIWRTLDDAKAAHGHGVNPPF